MTLDLEVNEVEVKVLASLASVTWMTGLDSARCTRRWSMCSIDSWTPNAWMRAIEWGN